jgi:DNA-binding GntR family transcriptional regulator
VRDALHRLRDERLVEMAPQRFTRVAPLELRDVRQVIPILAAVHGLATELAVPRIDRAAVQEMRVHNDAFMAALVASDGRAAYAADERFHAVLVDGCGNPEIGRVLARLLPRLHRVEHLGEGGLPGRRSVAQHQAMVTRAEAGDAAGAGSAARANWMTLGTVLERSFG